jgi:hypothetical protein
VGEGMSRVKRQGVTAPSRTLLLGIPRENPFQETDPCEEGPKKVSGNLPRKWGFELPVRVTRHSTTAHDWLNCLTTARRGPTVIPRMNDGGLPCPVS